MKLEIGKRYVRRDGVVTDRIRGANCKIRWATDGQYSWLADGGHYLESKAESTMDIVSEYIEPKPFPRYFVGSLWSNEDAYVRFDTPERYTWVNNEGVAGAVEDFHIDKASKSHSWREVTEAEAMARITKPQQPLRWMENCKPDKPGIWLWRQNDGYVHCHYVDNNRINETWQEATRCYLGQIPEILPPVKKVTERLWLHFVGSEHKVDGFDLVRQVWLPDSQNVERTDFVRTDRTREREV